MTLGGAQSEEVSRHGNLTLIYTWRAKIQLRLKNTTIWYLGGGKAAAGNAVVAAGQALLFVLCLLYRHGVSVETENNL
jgi:hypothetical protein